MDRLLAIVGPTAVGKTQISIDLAKQMHTEIISGDSMLVYRGMDIGTAKPSLAERDGIVHHLIDILAPTEQYSVVDFQKQAGELIHRLNREGNIPILAGGTGLYVKALVEGYRFSDSEGRQGFRASLMELANTRGTAFLYEQLKLKAPFAAAELHPNDQRRIIRALETLEQTGKSVSRDKHQDGLIYDALIIGLTMSRDRLYERINRRVELMLAEGLVAEVTRLQAAGAQPSCQAMQAIGYKEMAAYLTGAVSLETAIEQIKQATRNFAKRQMTWYRKMHYINWVNVDEFSDYREMLGYIYSLVAGKFNPG